MAPSPPLLRSHCGDDRTTSRRWSRSAAGGTCAAALIIATLIPPPPVASGLCIDAPAAPTLTDRAPSWTDLRSLSLSTETGARLSREADLRSAGRGPPHVGAALRLFDAPDEGSVRVTLYRDRAAWCPYCQKVWLFLEEREVPYRAVTVPLNAYGDKPAWFTGLVDGGKLPAIELDGRLVSESSDIIALLDAEFPCDRLDGGGLAVPPEGSPDADAAEELLRLESDLQSAWFSLVFYPVEGDALDEARDNFLDAIGRVDAALGSTPGPWFLGGPAPSVVDVQYVPQVERIVASVLYWKGIELREGGRFPNLDRWLTAFEGRLSYRATKSDHYTLVMAIPSQNGPGYSVGCGEEARRAAARICGLDGAWALDASGGDGESNEAQRHRHEAAFVLTANHDAVVRFACRGAGEPGRPSFHAELADPYAEPNEDYVAPVDVCLRHVAAALLLGVTDAAVAEAASQDLTGMAGDGKLRPGWYEYADDDGRTYWWNEETGDATWTAPPTMQLDTCLTYLRDRVGVPRDMGEGAAMQLRAHLNWAIDLLNLP